jgi:glycosyltransferase involved in cell wall biosynthesis
MLQNIKLSIITPVYNGEKYIRSCINNVIEQRCPYVEHLIIDGKSTDNTLKIIKKYAKNYPHLRWVSEKDKGQSDAMNKGIRLAKADAISFLNVDDFYEPKVLNKVIKIFKKLPKNSFLVGNCKVWKKGKVIEINKPKDITLLKMLLPWHVNRYPANPSAYFYHKSLHYEFGFYNLRNHDTMDLEFIFKIAKFAKIIYTNQDFGNFRLVKGSKTFESIENFSMEKKVTKLKKKFLKNLTRLEKIELYYLMKKKPIKNNFFNFCRRLRKRMIRLINLFKKVYNKRTIQS